MHRNFISRAVQIEFHVSPDLLKRAPLPRLKVQLSEAEATEISGFGGSPQSTSLWDVADGARIEVRWTDERRRNERELLIRAGALPQLSGGSTQCIVLERRRLCRRHARANQLGVSPEEAERQDFAPDAPRGNAICRMVDAAEVAFVAVFLA